MKRILFKKQEEKDILKVAKEEKQIHSDINSLIDQRLKIYNQVKKEPDKKSQTELVTPVEEANNAVVESTSKNTEPVQYIEKKGMNWNSTILYLTVLGVVGIIFFSMYMESSPSFLLLTWLFGTLCFLPLGVILGWLFMNPDTRCLIMRRTRGKNYGIVHFVHRGGQRMVTRIKNFDDDVIIQDTKMWILSNDGIYYMDKARNKILHAKIDSEHIKTLPANIPVLYLDSNTMVPLTFNSTQSQSNPQQVGSTILGYIYNQVAKSLFMKKGLQIFFIIILILTGVTLAATIQVAMWVDEIRGTMNSLMTKLNRLNELTSELERYLGIDENITPTPDGG